MMLSEQGGPPTGSCADSWNSKGQPEFLSGARSVRKALSSWCFWCPGAQATAGRGSAPPGKHSQKTCAPASLLQSARVQARSQVTKCRRARFPMVFSGWGGPRWASLVLHFKPRGPNKCRSGARPIRKTPTGNVYMCISFANCTCAGKKPIYGLPASLGKFSDAFEA